MAGGNLLICWQHLAEGILPVCQKMEALLLREGNLLLREEAPVLDTEQNAEVGTAQVVLMPGVEAIPQEAVVDLEGIQALKATAGWGKKMQVDPEHVVP